jgi:hypothetical protein
MLTLKNLLALQGLVKIKSLAEKAGLNYPSLMQKAKRNSELTVTDSAALTNALKSFFREHGWELKDTQDSE